VSFVSVTQAFNTTTSMGRLTLNVLLSFAQFEREVTGERIRDKIAASKKKGLWMGGNLPLGYGRKDNTLVINPAEAETVRQIFERYLEIGSVDKLQRELADRNIKSKCRVTRKGETIGGVSFSRGALYHLLSNHHYRGLIRHKDELHAGLHEAIIDEPLFDAVQAQLLEQRTLRHSRTTRPARLRLAGRVVANGGTPFTPSFGYGRGQQPYRYYIVPSGVAAGAADGAFPHRLPAGPLEEFVEATLRRLLGNQEADWSMLDPLLVRMEVFANETHMVLDAENLFGDEHPDLAFEALQCRLKIGERVLVEPGPKERLRVCLNRRLSFRGGRAWMVDQTDDRQPRIDPVLVAGLKNAHAILADEGIDPQARRYARNSKSPVHPYQRKLCLLALLSPELQVGVIEGRTPKSLTLHDLVSGAAPPLLWREQQVWMFARHPAN
jgi:site-specific DNA recombinase